MTRPGDLQACPWCPFVGTPTLFDLHMADHEAADLLGPGQELAEAKEEIRLLKVKLKERHKDYVKTLTDAYMQLEQDGGILREIAAERARQDEKWGEQNHPNGTDTKWAVVADGMKAKCEGKSQDGRLTFRDILEEEIWEAYAEEDEGKLRAELLQCAAVIVNWIGAIDRRKSRE